MTAQQSQPKRIVASRMTAMRLGEMGWRVVGRYGEGRPTHGGRGSRSYVMEAPR